MLVYDAEKPESLKKMQNLFDNILNECLENNKIEGVLVAMNSNNKKVNLAFIYKENKKI